jgi:hypothetical protein|nr:MAG TPA: hypothetical protein [Caudoviricetes sp.]
MKNKIETIKTVVITVLITAIVAFIGGMQYQKVQHNQVKSEVSSIIKNVKDSTPKH